MQKYKLILASGSPRRQQFFKDLNLDFSVNVKEVDEVYPDHLKAQEITNYLAILKANAFNDSIQPNELIITSDTIVWLNDKALGKPKDYDDAVAILKSLSNNTHEVITSVCFKTIDSFEVIHDITKVTFSEISDENIKYYIDNFKPYDKAGAYGIQDWIGLTSISKIEGSYTNVVGMPTEKVFKILTSHYI
jgi:septum formation protein